MTSSRRMLLRQLCLLSIFTFQGDDIYIRYQTPVNPFNVKGLLYADEWEIQTHWKVKMQAFIDHCFGACKAFSLDKIKVIQIPN